jgi:hypothetical protein
MNLVSVPNLEGAKRSATAVELLSGERLSCQHRALLVRLKPLHLDVA